MMSRHKMGWVAPALALGLFGFILYGFNENQQRSAMVAQFASQEKAEYMGLAFDADEMQDDLAKAIVTTTPEMRSTMLQRAARSATSARVFAAHLPEYAWSDGATMALLDRVTSDAESFSAQLAGGRSLSTTDLSKLQTLYSASTKLEKQLRLGEGRVQQADLRDAFAQDAGAAARRPGGDAMSSALKGVDMVAKATLTSATKPSEGRRSTLQPSVAGTSLWKGPIISGADAIAIAYRVVPGVERMQGTVTRLGAGYDYPGYLVTFMNPRQSATPITASVSLHGGHVVWFISPQVDGAALRTGMLQAPATARHYLLGKGYGTFETVDVHPYGGVAMVTLAPVRHGVVFLNAPILVKVYLSTGAIRSVDASAYWLSGDVPTALRPQIAVMKARSALSPAFRVEEEQLAVVDEANQRPALVYDFLGRTTDNTFHVYVDAMTGKTVNVDKLTKEDQGR